MSIPYVSMAPCGRQFEHKKKDWSITLPLDRLPSWVRFYRHLRDRKGRQYSQHYAADVEALERFAAQLDRAVEPMQSTQKDEVAA